MRRAEVISLLPSQTVEIITALYFNILRINPQNPKWEERDRFILSKGHGCAALYAALAEKGFFPTKLLNTFCKTGSILLGHPEVDKVPGIEVSTGSLGHGLSIAVGISLAAKYDNKAYRVFVLLGDGECQEGSVWEAVMAASHFKLDNLIAIVDNNGLQAIGAIDEIISLEPLSKKWESFGWTLKEVDGHNLKQLLETLANIPFKKDRPNVVIANTIKGKDISFMENKVFWHTRTLNKEEQLQAIRDLELKDN